MNAKTPSELDTPSYLLNFPFTVDNHTPNNCLMLDEPGPYDYNRAYLQFQNLYKTIVTEGGLVYLLPSEKDYQDLAYIANLGCYLPHAKIPTILLSNFKSEPRIGEEKIGEKFFESMRYRTIHCPYSWEGEADLKWMNANHYIGGYGQRTEKNSYYWMQDKLNMEIIPILMPDERLYHFDCMFFAFSEEKALVATSIMSDEDIKILEKHVEIISVPEQYTYDGWTNSLRINNKILYSIPTWDNNSRKALESLLTKQNYEPVGINLSEYAKSGADLSCFCMHLNFVGRNGK